MVWTVLCLATDVASRPWTRPERRRCRRDHRVWVVAPAGAGLRRSGDGRAPAADYPPPPARVEFVPKSPKDGAVWLDGEWTWQGQRWAWKSGRWVAPPANAKFSPWTATRGQTGIYYVRRGDVEGQRWSGPPRSAGARGRPGPGRWRRQPGGRGRSADPERPAGAHDQRRRQPERRSAGTAGDPVWRHSNRHGAEARRGI